MRINSLDGQTRRSFEMDALRPPGIILPRITNFHFEWVASDSLWDTTI